MGALRLYRELKIMLLLHHSLRKFAQSIGIASAVGALMIVLIPQVSNADVTDLCPREPNVEYVPSPDETIGTVRRTQHQIQQNAEQFQAYLELGEALSWLCRFDESLEAYTQVTKRTNNPQFVSKAYNGIGSQLFRKRKFQEAILAHRKAIQVAGQNGELALEGYRGLGLIFENQGDVEAAISAYRKAISLVPNPDRFYVLDLVNLLRQKRRFSEMVQLLQQAYQRSPNDPDVVDDLGRALVDAQRFREAESLYRQQIKKIPSDIYAYFSLASVLRKQGNTKAAIATYETAVNIYQPSRNPQVCISTAGFPSPSRELVEQKLYNLALELCQKQIAGKSYDGIAYNQVGEILVAQGKLQEALSAFKRATTLSPKYSQAWTNLTKIERLLKQ